MAHLLLLIHLPPFMATLMLITLRTNALRSGTRKTMLKEILFPSGVLLHLAANALVIYRFTNIMFGGSYALLVAGWAGTVLMSEGLWTEDPPLRPLGDTRAGTRFRVAAFVLLLARLVPILVPLAIPPVRAATRLPVPYLGWIGLATLFVYVWILFLSRLAAEVRRKIPYAIPIAVSALVLTPPVLMQILTPMDDLRTLAGPADLVRFASFPVAAFLVSSLLTFRLLNSPAAHPDGTQRAADRLPEPDGSFDPELLSLLTERERQIARLLADRFSYREIADRLGISIATVKTHAHRVYEKTEAGNRENLRRRLGSDRNIERIQPKV